MKITTSQNFSIVNVWKCWLTGKTGVDCWNGRYLLRLTELHLFKNGKEIIINDYRNVPINSFSFDMVDLDYYPGVRP